MARRVPVLGDDDVLERRRQRVDDRHDLGAALDRQRAAVDEAVLHVDDDQRRLGVGLDLVGRARGARDRPVPHPRPAKQRPAGQAERHGCMEDSPIGWAKSTAATPRLQSPAACRQSIHVICRYFARRHEVLPGTGRCNEGMGDPPPGDRAGRHWSRAGRPPAALASRHLLDLRSTLFGVALKLTPLHRTRPCGMPSISRLNRHEVALRGLAGGIRRLYASFMSATRIWTPCRPSPTSRSGCSTASKSTCSP